MFMRMFFIAWSVLHIYVFWRLTSIPIVVRYIPRKILIVIGVILWTTILLRQFANLPEIFVMNWLGILFLIFVSFLVVDIITAFGFLFRRQAPSLRALGLLAGVVLSATALIQGMRPPVVHDYEVRLPGLPVEDDGLVIAVISDLHVGQLLDGQWLAARIAQVQALKPDLVFILGDVFEGDSQSERQDNMNSILKALQARYGVWGVTGNHESHGGVDSSVHFLESAGVRLLRNEWVEVIPGLALGGIDDGGHQDSPGVTADRLKRILAAKPNIPAAVFLSHRPQNAEEIAGSGVGLMLSGHTHGGQIWPFSYITGLVNPFLAGRYKVGRMSLIVTRGTGTWGPRMRLWAPSEILRITLKADSVK